MLDARRLAGPLQASLGDEAVGAFDLAGADRQSFGQGLEIVRLVSASAEVAMAGCMGVCSSSAWGGSDRPASACRTASRLLSPQRLLLGLDPGVVCDRVGRDRR